jgi:hypothetical protein
MVNFTGTKNFSREFLKPIKHGGIYMDTAKIQEGVLCQLKIGHWSATTRLNSNQLGEEIPKDIVRAMQDLLTDKSLTESLLSIKRKALRILKDNSLDFPVDGVFGCLKTK